MNYRVKKKIGKLQRKKCHALARHGGRCKKRVTSSSSFCQHHKHLMLGKDRDILPGLTKNELQENYNGLDTGIPATVVHNITPDGMDGSDADVVSIPHETPPDNDAPPGETPKLISEPSDILHVDQSQERGSITEEVNDTVKLSGHSDGHDTAAAVAYSRNEPDSPPAVNFPEQQAESGDHGTPVFQSSFNQNSGNTMKMNSENTMKQNCDNITTNNDSSQNVNVKGVMAGKYYNIITNVVTNNYPGFPFSEEILKALAQTAAAVMPKICQTYNVAPGCEKAMVELALFDMVIVCDNSNSMYRYSDAMRRTLRHLVTIASLLLPKGITIQFLNTNKDGKYLYENITDGYQVDNIFQNARFLGIRRVWNTPGLGDVLDQDIIHPMILRKAKARVLKRPVISIMLTDADIPSAQGRETLKSSIRSCKKAKDLEKYGDKATLFLLSRVGNSRRGKEFVSELEKDSSINDVLHCSTGSLDQWLTDCQTIGNEDTYTGHLIDLFLTALDRNGTA
ncbi:hypothetical protein ASPBRDRAFT_71223 [Aspergillus brasiliensis CBS 101740]|uniref:VWFA domain-containing protein n=1 Tax=Aspergillus brasiliensis (strain CBS 101740 / IMI 381727 / IBT 21946) TaxID=767769 RepID=A0A1L9V282_ASPBC|nr:hypothetical protein ASPBRDRAFT_71223 [Aspergillus brasiliensis CBS 101740]